MPPCSSSPSCSATGFVREQHPGQRQRAALRPGRLHHPHRELRGARHRGVEHVLRADSALHRRRPALPAHRAPCAGRVVRLGARRLGHRRGHGHAPHRHGQRPDRRPGLRAPLRPHRPHGLAPAAPPLGRLERPPGRAWPRRPPPRGSAAPSRRWPCGPATGRWPPSSSCCPPTGPRTSVQSAITGMADGTCRAGTPTSSPPRPTCSRRPGPRRPGSWPPSPSPSGSGPWWPAARLVPGRRRAARRS